MKKYEAPIVELTKFDVEDVITTSVVDTASLSGDAATEAKEAIETVAGANNLDGVFTW